MKIRISMKNPDCVHDAVDEAVREAVDKIPDLDEEEAQSVSETRRESTFEKLSKWIEYKEYITVEFDTEEMTAVVVPVK